MRRLLTDAAQVDVWFWSTAGWPAAAVPRCELSGDELAQAAALGRREPEFVINRALLRRTLSHYAEVAPADWRFGRNACGKPVVVAEGAAVENLQFNFSHAGDLSICAVCRDVSVGVDLEAHANDVALLTVADQYFSERELADLKALPEAEQGRAFFDYWTLKEAYIKARGQGLVQPLDSFSFFPRRDDDVGFECAPEFAATSAAGEIAWHFSLLRPAPGYTAALAVQLATPRISLWVARNEGSARAASPGELAALLGL